MRSLIFAAMMALAPALASADQIWVSCSGCSSGSASSIANQKAPPLLGNGTSEHTVYVLNKATRSTYKFLVITDREPGLYNRAVIPAPVESSVSNSLSAFWTSTQNIYALEVPESRAPSASGYLSNPYNTGRTRDWITSGGEGFIAQMNAAIFVATISANQALAALGADRGPIVLRLTFDDGSKIEIQVTLGTNGLGGDPIITEIKVVPNSAFTADGTPLPTSASGFNNYSVENLSNGTIDDFLDLAQSYGIPVTRGACSSRSRWECDATGDHCTLVVRCN